MKSPFESTSAISTTAEALHFPTDYLWRRSSHGFGWSLWVTGKPQDRLIGSLPDVSKPVEVYTVKLSNGEGRVLRLERTPAGEVKVTVSPQAGAGIRAGK